jgi:biopolymer transport protein ExbB
MHDTFLAFSLAPAVDFFLKGGVFMIFLLILSVLSLTVILLRGSALREKAVMPAALINEVQRLEPGDNLDNLQKLIAAHPSALGRILAMLLRQLTWPRAEAVEAVQTQARHEVARLETGLVLLEMSTGVAPLFGLLGTLSGLVGIFANIGGGGDPVGIARGIAEALNTTIVGLAVAAPSLIALNYYQRKIEVMSVEMESLVGDLLAKCYPQGAAPTILTLDKK